MERNVITPQKLQYFVLKVMGYALNIGYYYYWHD